VTAVGNCDEIKNHRLLAEALNAVSSPVHVMHVGHRRQQPTSEAAAWRDLDPRHVVHHLGERGDVPALLAASDLFAQPSLREGFSLAAAEALCAGVPLIVADSAGLRLLAAVETARIVPRDARAWGEAVESALSAPPDSAALATSAAAARKRFEKARGVEQYVDAYRTSLRASRLRR